MQGRVLIVAGSDSGGGAGIQADIKTVSALGGYAMTAVTALTAQNTQGVFGVIEVAAEFIAQQMTLCLTDIGADAIKTGMIPNAAAADAIADVVQREAGGLPLVVDPVMVAKGGQPLLDRTAVDALMRRLIPRATLLTPNLPEAETLTGLRIRNAEEMRGAGAALVGAGARAVLVKGGHLPGERVTDLLVTAGGAEVFESPRLESRNTHGTGCTLASAIATGLAQGLALADAIRRARAFVLEAIRTAPGLGRGHGPLNHGLTVRPFVA